MNARYKNMKLELPSARVPSDTKAYLPSRHRIETLTKIYRNRYLESKRAMAYTESRKYVAKYERVVEVSLFQVRKDLGQI